VRLKKLSGGTTYRTLLDDFYPPLRRTEYTIVYHVRPFSVEEARKIIKTDPKLLNLNEMYMVARSYPAGSKDFKDVFDISARLYPDNELSILNSASADIEGGNVDAALERLSRIADDAKSWNDFGVGYALKGDFSKAKEYLDKAAANGDANAQYNLEELGKVIKQQ
jgi:tetratricopeptide (TPR) repeat protein